MWNQEMGTSLTSLGTGMPTVGNGEHPLGSGLNPTTGTQFRPSSRSSYFAGSAADPQSSELVVLGNNLLEI